MKRIISFAASLLALAAFSSCQKLAPTEVTAEEMVNRVTVTVNVTYQNGESKINVPAGTKVDLITSSGIHIQKTTGGQNGNQVEATFGCTDTGLTVTAKATFKINGEYLHGSNSVILNHDEAKLINLNLTK